MKKISFCSFGTPQSFAEYKATDVIRTLQHAFIDQGWDVFLLHNNLQTHRKTLLFISEKPNLLLLYP
ncbi:MAG: hypothetical protein VX278_13170 [Myxococcota bacterium]|nr:hypothetical protein [Myxococcota bacterium]